MLDCFQVLHYVDNCVFWKLKPDAVKIGLVDTMGGFLEVLNDNEVGVFTTHDNSGCEVDVVEQSVSVPFSWWYENKGNSNIKTLCSAYTNFTL